MADIKINNDFLPMEKMIEETGEGYIKYGSGIMICWGKDEGTTKYSDYFNFLDRSPEGKITNFGQTFIDKPIVYLSPEYYRGTISVALESISTTAFTAIAFKAKGNSTTNYGFNWMAIGKWK